MPLLRSKLIFLLSIDLILDLISKYTEEKPGAIALALPYNDRNGELYVEDIQKQLDWYQRNGSDLAEDVQF
jgi:hypothetical protein